MLTKTKKKLTKTKKRGGQDTPLQQLYDDYVSGEDDSTWKTQPDDESTGTFYSSEDSSEDEEEEKDRYFKYSAEDLLEETQRIFEQVDLTIGNDRHSPNTVLADLSQLFPKFNISCVYNIHSCDFLSQGSFNRIMSNDSQKIILRFSHNPVDIDNQNIKENFVNAKLASNHRVSPLLIKYGVISDRISHKVFPYYVYEKYDQDFEDFIKSMTQPDSQIETELDTICEEMANIRLLASDVKPGNLVIRSRLDGHSGYDIRFIDLDADMCKQYTPFRESLLQEAVKLVGINPLKLFYLSYISYFCILWYYKNPLSDLLRKFTQNEDYHPETVKQFFQHILSENNVLLKNIRWYFLDSVIDRSDLDQVKELLINMMADDLIQCFNIPFDAKAYVQNMHTESIHRTDLYGKDDKIDPHVIPVMISDMFPVLSDKGKSKMSVLRKTLDKMPVSVPVSVPLDRKRGRSSKKKKNKISIPLIKTPQTIKSRMMKTRGKIIDYKTLEEEISNKKKLWDSMIQL